MVIQEVRNQIKSWQYSRGGGEIKRTGSQMMVIQEREKSKGNCEGGGGWGSRSRAERGLDRS